MMNPLMKKSTHAKRPKLPLACLLLGAALGLNAASAQTPEQTQQPPASQQASLAPSNTLNLSDGIAAVVNKQVITRLQLERDVALTKTQLAMQNVPLPDDESLRKQVLQRMITELLIEQETKRLNIRVSDEQLQMAVATIAQRNRMTPEQLRREVERTGLQWDNYLHDLSHEIRNERLRQLVVDNQITISDAEIDAFLKTQANEDDNARSTNAASNDLLRLAQILVRVPENATPEQTAQLRSRAEALLAQAQLDENFAQLAATFSDGAEGANGGDLGERALDNWPDLFSQAVRPLPAGGVSGLIRSGNGFHILKVVSRATNTSTNAPENSTPQLQLAQGAMVVTQTHARHILLKASPAMTQTRATQRLAQLRQRIEMGESFEDLARRYSEDASAPQGGDLGWTSPGEMVPAFEQAMQALAPGQVSEVIQTPFGWHLIRVEARRSKDVKDQTRRLQARQILFQRRAEPAFEDWLSQLQGQAYIDNRLEPQQRRSAQTAAAS